MVVNAGTVEALKAQLGLQDEVLCFGGQCLEQGGLEQYQALLRAL